MSIIKPVELRSEQEQALATHIELHRRATPLKPYDLTKWIQYTGVPFYWACVFYKNVTGEDYDGPGIDS